MNWRKKIRFSVVAGLLAAGILTLVGCSKDSYITEKDTKVTSYAGGYFTCIESWMDENGDICRILYANDTKVKYFTKGAKGIAPLYNTDGTLQVYEEEE